MIEIDLNKDKLIIESDSVEQANKMMKRIEESKNKLIFMPTDRFIIVRNCK